MSDIVERLRQTRADMLGTPDEAHYWDCVEAAAEIERLETERNALRAENERTRSLLRWDIAEDDEGVILCDGDQERRFYHMSIVDALRAKNEKLRAALKPFAIDFAIDIGEEYDDDDWFDNYNPKDLRAAAAALKETGG